MAGNRTTRRCRRQDRAGCWGGENRGERDTLDAGNLRGLKSALRASSGHSALLGRFREKTARSVALYGTISTARRVTVLGFPPRSAE